MDKRSAIAKELRVLNVEDSERDAALLTRHLTKAGYKIESHRVQTAESMKAALEDRQWDVVLCDYSMPHFDALGALAALRASGIDIPFIIISGTVGEEIAVQAMLSGAHDYLSKDNLSRLVPAVEREIKDANIRHQLKWEGEERRVSEKRYRTLFEYAPDGIIISGPDDYYLDANTSMCKMLGYTHLELVGLHASDIVIRSEARELDSEFALVQSTPNYNREWHFRRKDDSVFPAEVIATIMPDGNLLAMIRDTSERTRTRQIRDKLAARIEAQRTRLDTIIESVPGIVWETTWDVHRTVEEEDFVSSYAMTMLGYSVDEWLATPDFWLNIVHEDDRERVRAKAKEALVRSEANIDEFRWVKKDGQMIWVEARSSIICDADGNQIGIRGVTIDITDRKRAENERRIIAEIIEKGIRISDLDQFLNSVHASLSEAMYAENCFVMLRDPVTNLHRFAFWADKYDPVPAQQTSSKGFGSYVLRTGKPLMINEEVKKEIIQSGEAEQIGSFSPSWLGVPLRTPSATIGVLVLQHYEVANAYRQRDLDFLASVGDQLAMAIERIRAEERLRESESLLAASQRITHLGSWVMDVSDEGEIIENTERWSDEHYRIFGFEPGEIKVTDEVFYRSVHPDDRESVAKMLRETIEHQEPYDLEHRIILPDGTERIVHAMAEVVHDAKTGKVQKLLGSVQDITERKRAEEDIQRRQTELRVLFDLMPAMIWFKDTENNILRVNKQAADAAGLTVEEIEGKPAHEIYPDESARFYADDLKVVRSGKPKLGYEERLPGPDGGKLWVQTDKVPYFDNEGKPIGIVVMAQDVTDRRKAAEALAESEERYRELVENAIDMIYTHDLEGNYTSVNRATERITGYTKDEILGMNIADAIPVAELETAKKIIAAKLVGEDAPTHEVELLAKNGHGVMVEVNSRIVYENGIPIGVQGIARDITARKKAEEALRETEERYRDLVENAIDSIYTLDLEGNYTSVSEAGERITGYSRQQSLGQNFNQTVAPEYQERAAHFHAEQIAGREVAAFELYVIAQDGRRVALEINTRSIKENGVVVGVQGIARDISARKKAEEALRETEERYRELVENAIDIIYSHDLEGNYTSVNRAGEKITGYTNAEILAMNMADTLAPEYLGKAMQMLAEKLAGNETAAYEVELIAKDGHRVALEVNTRIVSENGVAVGVQGIARDITDRKLAEATLRESDEKFHQLADHISDVFWIRSPDMSKIYYISPAYEQIWGRSLKDDYAEAQDWYEFILPQDRQSVKEAYAGLINDKSKIAVEYRILRPDGEQRWVRARGFQVKDNTGKVIRLAGIVTDITRRKQAESEIEQTLQRLKDAQRIGQIGDFTWDKATDAITWSPEIFKIVGRDPELGPPKDYEEMQECFDMHSREVMDAKTALAIQTGETQEYELVAVRPDGERMYVQAMSEPRKDANGNIFALAGTIQDISARKRAELALTDSEIRYHSLFENMIEGYAYCETIFEGDQLRDFVYTEVNGSFENLTGLKDVVGKKVSELIPGLDKASPELFETYGRVALTGKPEKFETYVQPLDIWLSITVYSSNRETFVVVFDNITERRRAQTLLIESEEQLALAAESVKLGIWDWDVVDDKLEWDNRMYELHGMRIGEFGGAYEAWQRGLHPGDRAQCEANIQAALKGERPYNNDFRVVWPNGEVRNIEARALVERDDNGEPIRMIGVNWDITDRKKAETLLIESERSLALATESASIGIWDWDLVEDTMKWDARMYELYGNHDEDFTGPSQTWNLNLHPDDIERVYAEYATAIEGSEDFHSEFCVLWPNGEVRHLESTAKILRDENAKAVHFIGVNWDITERKIAEETLRESDQRAIREYGLLLTRVAKLALALGDARELETVYEHLREFALVSTKMDGLIISLYNAELKTRTAAYVWSDGVKVDVSTLSSMPMSDSPHSRSVSRGEIIFTDDFQSAMDGQPVLHLGGDVPRSSLVVPMSVMGRVVGGVEVQSNDLAAFHDHHATAMQMAANLAANAIENVRLLDIEIIQGEQLRQSQKMEAVGVLAGGIAHDFNNLLTAINGYSDLTLRKMKADDPLRHNVEEVKKAGDRAAELTSQLLAFSRKQVLKPRVHSLNSVIENIEKMLRRIIRENIELRTVLDPILGNVKADPGQVEQVIMNLAVNARDAMEEGGTLAIETQNVYLDEDYVSQNLTIAPGPFVRLTVTDTGSGMDEITKRHIFEPFFTTKEVGKGTGLGLSMVYGIVKQSGGDIMVYSELGHGTTFKIYLPRVEEDVDKPKWIGDREKTYVGSETILLVEDEEIVRNLVRAILTESGYNVLEANSGKAALEVCSSYDKPIHLLLSDVIMPKMSGSALKDEVVKILPDIKVLFMSGYTDDSIANRGVFDEAIAFIEKPFTRDSLGRKVREVLEG